MNGLRCRSTRQICPAMFFSVPSRMSWASRDAICGGMRSGGFVAACQMPHEPLLLLIAEILPKRLTLLASVSNTLCQGRPRSAASCTRQRAPSAIIDGAEAGGGLMKFPAAAGRPGSASAAACAARPHARISPLCPLLRSDAPRSRAVSRRRRSNTCHPAGRCREHSIGRFQPKSAGWPSSAPASACGGGRLDAWWQSPPPRHKACLP